MAKKDGRCSRSANWPTTNKLQTCLIVHSGVIRWNWDRKARRFCGTGTERQHLRNPPEREFHAYWWTNLLQLAWLVKISWLGAMTVKPEMDDFRRLQNFGTMGWDYLLRSWSKNCPHCMSIWECRLSAVTFAVDRTLVDTRRALGLLKPWYFSSALAPGIVIQSYRNATTIHPHHNTFLFCWSRSDVFTRKKIIWVYRRDNCRDVTTPRSQ